MSRSRILALSAAVSIVALGFAAPPVAAQMPPGQKNESTTLDKTGRFAHMAAMTNRFEIEAAQLALEKSRNQQVREFAQHMINDHRKMSQQLETAANTKPVPSVAGMAAMDPEHTQKLQQLRSASGAEFDRLYINMQIAGHHEALGLHQDYARTGTDPELKQVATQATPEIQQHLQRAQALAQQIAQVPRGVAPADRSPIDSDPGRNPQAGPNEPSPQAPQPPYRGQTPGERN